MRNLGMEDNDKGNSSMWLFARFNISRFTKFARPGGTAINTQ